MLDIVRHHGQHRGDEISAKIFVMQRREGELFLRFSSCQKQTPKCRLISNSNEYGRLRKLMESNRQQRCAGYSISDEKFNAKIGSTGHPGSAAVWRCCAKPNRASVTASETIALIANDQ